MHRPFIPMILSLAACRVSAPATSTSTSTAPTRAVPPAESASDVASSAPTAAPRPLPAVSELVVHLPGADANRFANLTIDIQQMPWTITGCVSSGRGSCRGTQRIEMTPDDRARYVEHWQAIYAMGRCERLARWPDDRIFTLSAAGATYEDPLPADSSQIAARTAEPCAAPARLVVWAARRFGAMLAWR